MPKASDGVKLRIATVGQETGALLKTYLVERGVYNSKSSATVSYGVHTEETPNLNGNCARGKIFNLNCLQQNNVLTVPWFQGIGGLAQRNISFPLLARRNHGHGGEDIVPVFQEEEIPWRIAAGWDWFSQYIPVAAEYRVWVFRDVLLDIYKKVMRRPADYKFIGRNFRNGFHF